MGYERDGRSDRYGRRDQDSGPDYSGGSSAREYQAAGQFGGDRGGSGDRQGYGRQDYGYDRYGQRDRMSQGYGDQNRDDYRREGYSGGGDYYRGDQSQGESRRSYGQGSAGEDRGRDTYRQQRGSYSRQPRDYDNDRGFMDRAGDEVRSWFGDEEAERRREMDARRDEQQGGGGYGRDEHYHSWRNQQLQQFDRDYHEYRQENQSKFHNEFASFRSERQSQRELLNRVEEHAEVVGSDGEHVGTVDKVRDDRIILTKNDKDAGGRHHSIPSRWLQSADGTKVTLRKTASEAKAHWRDEERQSEQGGAMFGQGGSGAEQGRSNQDGLSTSGTNLNRSFSGTY